MNDPGQVAGGTRVVAAVQDLFFVARIRETARLVDTPVVFARTAEAVRAELGRDGVRLVIVDLAARDISHGEIFAALETPERRAPVLGITTHALAAETRPFHPRCDRVVTRETLTKELATILRDGIAA